MKERNCLEWIILCELARAKKRYGANETDEYLCGDASVLSEEHEFSSPSSTSDFSRMIVREVSSVVSGQSIPGKYSSGTNLRNWYRSGGQF